MMKIIVDFVSNADAQMDAANRNLNSFLCEANDVAPIGGAQTLKTASKVLTQFSRNLHCTSIAFKQAELFADRARCFLGVRDAQGGVRSLSQNSPSLWIKMALSLRPHAYERIQTG